MTTFLIFFVLVLFFLVIFYVSKALDFARIVKEGLHNTYEGATKVNAILMILFYVIGMIVLVWTSYSLLPRLLPESASVHGEELDKMYDIEKILGRKLPRKKNQPRTIDIDIVLFGNSFIETEELTIPHPHALLRKFVLIPLAELIPKEIFPSTNYKIVDLLN